MDAPPPPRPRQRLATPLFALMWFCGFAGGAAGFQLFPTVPHRIRELGGSTAASGLFLGVLTYASAFSAPWTGALADFLGRRRVLVGAGLGLAALSLGYVWVTDWRVLVALAAVHGVLWSSQLTAAAAQAADLVPADRRAEGMGYYGLSMILAVTIAPPLGFALLHLGWPWLCLSLAAVDLVLAAAASRLPSTPRRLRFLRDGTSLLQAVDWRTLAVASILFLGCFGYGGLTSFVTLFSEARGIAPRSLFFTVYAGTVIVARLALGGAIDRVGHRRALAAGALLLTAAQAALPLQTTALGLGIASAVFGVGMSLLSPAFSGYILERVDAERRGAAFGAWIAAMDTGIGTGSMVLGWVIERRGFGAGFGLGALAAALAWPAFVAAERLLEKRQRA